MQTWNRIRRDSTGSNLLLREWVATATILFLSPLSIVAAPTEGNDFFESKIRPIFVENCQRCHGADEQSSGLRLDSGKAALTGGDSGPAIVPGKPDEGELIGRITDPDDDLRMPPLKEGKRLNEEQVAAIKEWIKAGAPWPESSTPVEDAKAKLRREHWAFQPVKQIDPPEVHDGSRVHTPVDQFVIAKLESAGLQLSPEADRPTLIRRATYDLTGLPPTAEEVESFVNDKSPDAYERLIDRLLDSPHYGEQWGRHWLDIARFSDTKGYVYARENRFFIHSALYRDWVINALNEDMPYDRFVTLQIAADQAAPDDPSSLVAMGFLTLGRRMLGVTPDVIEDRIDMVGRGLLGLTIGCARCHDHKFDPIPTADYYSLYGVFQNCEEREVPVPRKTIDADDKSTDAERNNKASDDTPAELKKLQKELAVGLAEHGKKAADRVRSRIGEYLAAQRDLENYVDLGIIATASEAELVPGFVRRFEGYIREADKRHDPVFTVWVAYAALKPEEFATRAAEVHEKLQADPAAINPRIATAFATPATSPDDVVDRYTKIFTEVDAEWKQLCDDAKAAGGPVPQAMADAADEAVRQVLYGPDAPCVVPNEPVTNTEYLWNLKEVEDVWKLQTKVDQYLLQHPRQAPYTVVLTDRKTIVDPQIFRRGNPMNKGDTVPRRFVEIASTGERKPFEHGSGRLELAKAIVDPNNPLTSRVWVNRVWLHHFGAGIVTTASDFGARSTPPSHPELLDWLASEFVQHGWSTKWLHRTLMLSAAYRQSSARPSAAQLAKETKVDPENRLLWRMNPHRLTFEQFRDTLLADSQELSDRMGGKGADLVSMRRSVYLQVDRQYLPTVFSVFDFANPDLHTSQRSETTNPQQALFALNNPFVGDRARKIAATIKQEANTPATQVSLAYRMIYQRDPTPNEVQAAAQFIQSAGNDTAEDALASDAKSWTYGYGEVDVKSGLVKSFHPLPHFTGSAWQGGMLWPDSALGWVRLTAKGGHTGNDHVHAAIRRWTVKSPGTISIKSEIAHQDSNGDGVRCWIVSSKDGVLAKAKAFNSRESLEVKSLAVEPNETLDFVVDVNENLGYDEFTWIPTIKELAATASNEGGSGSHSDSTPKIWNSEQSFPRVKLKPLEQFVQLLLVSNETMFVD